MWYPRARSTSGIICAWVMVLSPLLACQTHYPVLIVETHVAPSRLCIAGAIRVDAGEDVNSDGVLDASESSTSTTRCNSLDFMQAGSSGSTSTKALARISEMMDEVIFDPGAYEFDPGGWNTTNGSVVPKQVDLNHAVSVGRHEVTNRLYKTLTGGLPSRNKFKCVNFDENDPDALSDNAPVTCVGWMDALAFANAMSASSGLELCYVVLAEQVLWPRGYRCLGYRLATDVEWAAIGGNDNSCEPGLEKTDCRSPRDVASSVCTGGVCGASSNAYEWKWGSLGQSVPCSMGGCGGLENLVTESLDKRSTYLATVNFLSGAAGEEPRMPETGFRLVRTVEGSLVRDVHLSEVDIKVKANVHPDDYPAAAQGASGRCTVRLTVGTTGLVESAVALASECPEAFRVSAERVALRYKFYPYRDNGVPVRARFDLPFNFRGTE